jgi:glycosyltransferase involved in cell wall biosynthesis
VRIVHFSDTYLPRRDGVITSLRTLKAEQNAAGHATLTVVPRHPDQPDEAGLLRLRAMPLGPADLRVSPWLLRGAAATPRHNDRHHEPDVIHVHTPGPVGLLGVLAAKRLGLPLVQTYHTDLHAYVEAYRFPFRALRAGVRLYAHRLDVPRPPLRAVPAVPGNGRRSRAYVQRRAALDACNYLLLGDANAIIVPTRAVLDRITLPVPDDRIFLVPTGVPARPTAPHAVAAFRDSHNIRPDEPVILYVGRVNREKGIELLIPSFAQVLTHRPDARLVLVGAVYEPRWLDHLLRAAGPGIAERVVLTREQPPAVVGCAYGAAQVFAFPSQTDTQALVLQEAALAGVPVVMIDPVLHSVGPLGGHAIRADANPDSFGAALAQLLNDPVRARALGASAASHAASQTPARYATAVHDVYEHARAAAGHIRRDSADSRPTFQRIQGG